MQRDAVSKMPKSYLLKCGLFVNLTLVVLLPTLTLFDIFSIKIIWWIVYFLLIITLVFLLSRNFILNLSKSCFYVFLIALLSLCPYVGLKIAKKEEDAYIKKRDSISQDQPSVPKKSADYIKLDLETNYCSDSYLLMTALNKMSYIGLIKFCKKQFDIDIIDVVGLINEESFSNLAKNIPKKTIAGMLAGYKNECSSAKSKLKCCNDKLINPFIEQYVMGMQSKEAIAKKNNLKGGGQSMKDVCKYYSIPQYLRRSSGK